MCLSSERPNICKMVHLPLQSGSSAVLQRMRRGHTREVLFSELRNSVSSSKYRLWSSLFNWIQAYLALTQHMRSIIPNLSFSTDIIRYFMFFAYFVALYLVAFVAKPKKITCRRLTWCFRFLIFLNNLILCIRLASIMLLCFLTLSARKLMVS